MRSLSLAALLSFIALNGAFAQKYEISIIGGYPRLSDAPLGSIPLSEDQAPEDTKLKGEYTYGARFTVNSKGYLGHEFGYSQSRARIDTVFRGTDAEDNSFERRYRDRIVVSEGSYNLLLYMMPRGEWWRPYITIGGQTFHYGEPSAADWSTGSWRNYGINWGGGIKLKAGPALLRLDFRDYIQGKPYGLDFQSFNSGGLYHSMQGTVGVGFTF